MSANADNPDKLASLYNFTPSETDMRRPSNILSKAPTNTDSDVIERGLLIVLRR
jgi:hypothetical protein